MAVLSPAIGRVTNCDNAVRHPRRETPRTCLWVEVSGWQDKVCVCLECRDYLRRVGRTVTNVDPDFPEAA